MAEQPPLSRIHVVGYSANDRDFPLLALVLDPRVAGYQVPKDLSACPDKRYPNHVFTGAQPISGDQRVRHVWEILPSPYVPFTRYDDDLGPVQGRRRSVKNEGQVAIRQADKQVTYDAREGSAIVYTELEETWSIKTDDDGNSLFPIRDRDFYDASRGPVQERRQLFVPTGEEEGSLENVNGVITQTSYEPYNDFLSIKIVQTYSVDGPQLIGNATNNEGQLVTVTTQRKASDNYEAPQPTATRTVEASREDSETIVERIVDTPEVFGGETYRKTREDLTPQKFKAAQEDATFEQTIEGTAQTPTLDSGEFVKSEQQVNKFLKRISTTSRNIQSSSVLSEAVLNQDGQIGTRTLTLAFGSQSFAPSSTLVDASVEALGDGRTIKTEIVIPEVFDNKTFSIERPDPVPPKFRVLIPTETEEETLEGTASLPLLSTGQISKSEQQVTKFVKRTRTSERSDISEEKTIVSHEFTSDLGGGIAIVKETYPFNGSLPEKIIGTISDAVEDLGDGTKIRRQVTLPESEDLKLATLRGQEYDDQLDIVIPFSQTVVSANSEAAEGERKRVTPRDVAHSTVVEYNEDDVKTALEEYYWEVPDMVEISLPDKLKSAAIITDVAGATKNGSGNGDTYRWSYSATGSIRGGLIYDIEEGFRGNIPTTRAIFFLPKDK